jgi:hypothetical protein
MLLLVAECMKKRRHKRLKRIPLHQLLLLLLY